MSATKKELVETLVTLLHQEARSLGYVCAGIGDDGYRRINTMTSKSLQDEIARIKGTKQLKDLPADHICINVG
jgi:hypothetical protein